MTTPDRSKWPRRIGVLATPPSEAAAAADAGLRARRWRHKPEFDRWVERDLAYVDRRSLLLDLRTLRRTVSAVLERTGK